jgi:predicted RNA-binding Zn-ribbon protein involved in translation (DUF1610 family)
MFKTTISAKSVIFKCICGVMLTADVDYDNANTCPECGAHIRVQESKKSGRQGTAVFISVIKYAPRHRVLHKLSEV